MDVRPELAKNHRELALFNMAIDSKLRCFGLVLMEYPLRIGSEKLWSGRF